jgi:hypothetical protein
VNSSERWLKGIPHHPKSEKLFKFMYDRDWEEGGSLDLEYGGDGDNGESLMYLMDQYFEEQERES